MVVEPLPIGLGVADALVEDLAGGFPISGHRAHEGEEIRDADVIDAAGVYAGAEGERGECGVAAVAPAVNAESLWVGDLLSDEPIGGVNHIVGHFCAPLFVAGLDEFFAVAGGTAVIDLEDGVAE